MNYCVVIAVCASRDGKALQKHSFGFYSTWKVFRHFSNIFVHSFMLPSMQTTDDSLWTWFSWGQRFPRSRPNQTIGSLLMPSWGSLFGCNNTAEVSDNYCLRVLCWKKELHLKLFIFEITTSGVVERRCRKKKKLFWKRVGSGFLLNNWGETD